MTLDLWLLTDEPDPRLARVVSLTDHARLPLPVMTYGERVSATIRLVKRDGTYHSDSGATGVTATLLLGRRSQASLANGANMAASGSSWTCNLDLTTDPLALELGAVNGGTELALQFRTASGSNVNTWLSADAQLIGRVTA